MNIEQIAIILTALSTGGVLILQIASIYSNRKPYIRATLSSDYRDKSGNLYELQIQLKPKANPLIRYKPNKLIPKKPKTIKMFAYEAVDITGDYRGTFQIEYLEKPKSVLTGCDIRTDHPWISPTSQAEHDEVVFTCFLHLPDGCPREVTFVLLLDCISNRMRRQRFTITTSW